MTSPAPKSDSHWAAGSAHPDIITVGDYPLRQRCSPVENVKSASSVCAKMVNLLRELNGAGLAANQIGIGERIVVEVRKTDLFPDRPESPLYLMINPEIVESSKECDEGWEGCFSVPGLMGTVPRARTITVKYRTLDGDEKIEVFSGYLARVIQHECDHLDGHIFMDKMNSMGSLATVANYKRLHLGGLSSPTHHLQKLS